MIIIKLNIPNNFKVVLIKNDKKVLNILNNTKIFKFIIKDTQKIQFDKWGNSLLIKIDSKKKQIYLFNKIYLFLKSWDVFFFDKIKFKGKGFRIKSFKKKKLIKFYFGRSHKTFLLLKKIKKNRLSKYKYLFRSINSYKINVVTKIIKKIKKYNIYTLRGLRSGRQKIFKRKGKKGTYI